MGCVSLVDVVGVSLLMRGTRFTGLSRHSKVFVWLLLAVEVVECERRVHTSCWSWFWLC
jgi:hypothetical protein